MTTFTTFVAKDISIKCLCLMVNDYVYILICNVYAVFTSIMHLRDTMCTYMSREHKRSKNICHKTFLILRKSEPHIFCSNARSMFKCILLGSMSSRKFKHISIIIVHFYIFHNQKLGVSYVFCVLHGFFVNMDIKFYIICDSKRNSLSRCNQKGI